MFEFLKNHLPFVFRDYFDEIEAVLSVEPAGWTVKKLALWEDLVEKRTSQSMDATDENTVAEKEEEAEMAAFAALKSKIAKLD